MNHQFSHRIIQRFTLAFLTLACLTTPALFAQESEPTPITLGVQTSIHSEILGEDRSILIYTPDDYEHSSITYPVIYLLDGDGHLLHTAGITRFLSRNGKMPEAILVGIPNTDRTRDLTPAQTTPDERFPTAGGADTFLSFLADELVPYIETNYRTAPYRILVGHSFGGLFSVNALIKNPELFQAHISISPSMWWDNKGMLPQVESFLKENKKTRAFYYMTLGNEGGAMLAGTWGLAGIFEEHAPLGLKWHFELMKEETHGSIPLRSIYDGLEMLYDGWSIDNLFSTVMHDGIEGVDKHYASLSTRFGYDIQTPEAIVNEAGYALLGEDRIDRALQVFERNVTNFPNSPNVYDSLGDALKAKGEMEKAKENYTRACEMGEAANHPNTAVYCKNAEGVN